MAKTENERSGTSPGTKARREVSDDGRHMLPRPARQQPSLIRLAAGSTAVMVVAGLGGYGLSSRDDRCEMQSAESSSGVQSKDAATAMKDRNLPQIPPPS